MINSKFYKKNDALAAILIAAIATAINHHFTNEIKLDSDFNSNQFLEHKNVSKHAIENSHFAQSGDCHAIVLFNVAFIGPQLSTTA
jgi:hypothetical protein